MTVRAVAWTLAPVRTGGRAMRPTLLYDGSCRLCQGTVRFVALRLRAGADLDLVPLPSSAGERILRSVGRSGAPFHSVLLVEGGDVWDRSAAVLRTARWMRRPWSWLGALRAVPRPVRDAVYDVVARNRYRFFRGAGRPECACSDRE